ncbi:MAG: helix-turn-helix domain-containing protein [Tannerellaceae bacterium]|nr:helix-turn-helix domain-containing protein [Tannerellaceae bacterium]
MELKGLGPEEAALFTKKLEEITINIKEAFEKRTLTINGETYFTNQDMYDLLHISKRTLQEYRATQKISYFKFGGKILYKKSDIIKMLEENYYNTNL